MMEESFQKLLSMDAAGYPLDCINGTSFDRYSDAAIGLLNEVVSFNALKSKPVSLPE